MSHFGQRYTPFQREYFKNKLCLKCPQLKKPIKNNSLEIRHLLDKPGIFRDEIDKYVKEILNPRYDHAQPSNPVIVETNTNALKDTMSNSLNDNHVEEEREDGRLY